jgi:mono/diheme cytochrome c family protein
MVLGKRLYFTQGCSACHMSHGEGGPMAPPLRNLAQHWNREQLAHHMAEPDAMLKTDERLRQLSRQFPSPMKGVPAPEADRLLIADWLLSLQ